MKKPEFKHYIRIHFNDGDSYVTDFNNEDKTFHYKTGESAVSLSMEDAEWLCFGLLVNGYNAEIVSKHETFNAPVNYGEKNGRVQ